MIYILLSNNLYNDMLQDLPLWLRTGSNTTDINLFRSHTVKIYFKDKTLHLGPFVSFSDCLFLFLWIFHLCFWYVLYPMVFLVNIG